jgi:hypothetical protein
MNGFVIAIGTFIKDLTDKSLSVANTIGTVTVDMKGTACKVPSAADYIKKAAAQGLIGKKRTAARC